MGKNPKSNSRRIRRQNFLRFLTSHDFDLYLEFYLVSATQNSGQKITLPLCATFDKQLKYGYAVCSFSMHADWCRSLRWTPRIVSFRVLSACKRAHAVRRYGKPMNAYDEREYDTERIVNNERAYVCVRESVMWIVQHITHFAG